MEVTYLDTAAKGLPYSGCEEAMAAYFRDKASGTPGRARMHSVERETLGLVARMLNAQVESVAVLSSATEGLNLLANSLCWRAGDEVVLTDLEFPSNVLPWIRLRDRGVRVHVIPTRDGVVTLDDFARHISAATRLVTVSQVSYKTGTRVSFLPQLSEMTHAAGALLCVDATQALGRIPVSVQGVDFLVASSYKWLMAPHGNAVVYLAPSLREAIIPATVGWYSVEEIFTEDRFDRFRYKRGAAALVPGMPNLPGIYALGASLLYLLDVGVESIDATLAPLVRKFREGVAAMGANLLTPAAPEYASGIVAFAHPRADDVGAALLRRGITIWAGDGRVRASIHLYNEESDITRCLNALAPVLETALV